MDSSYLKRLIGGSVAIIVIFLVVTTFVAFLSVAFNVGTNVAAEVAGGDPTRAAMPYGPHYGWGFFPLFGILFWVLALFLIFGLVRAAFGGPRWRNGGPWMDRRTMAEEWHRQMHADLERRDAEPRDPGAQRRDQ